MPPSAPAPGAALPATSRHANAGRAHPPGRKSDSKAVGARITGAPATDASTAGEIAKEGWNLYAAGKVEEARDNLAAATAAGAGIWAEYALGLAEFTLQHAQAAATAWQRVRAGRADLRAGATSISPTPTCNSAARATRSRCLRDAARRWPKDSETHNAVGVVLVSRGAVDDAIDSFERAVNVAPDDGLGYYNLGRAYHLRYAPTPALERLQQHAARNHLPTPTGRKPSRTTRSASPSADHSKRTLARRLPDWNGVNRQEKARPMRGAPVKHENRDV